MAKRPAPEEENKENKRCKQEPCVGVIEYGEEAGHTLYRIPVGEFKKIRKCVEEMTSTCIDDGEYVSYLTEWSKWLEEDGHCEKYACVPMGCPKRGEYTIANYDFPLGHLFIFANWI
jgi:hypothetical protein